MGLFRGVPVKGVKDESILSNEPGRLVTPATNQSDPVLPSKSQEDVPGRCCNVPPGMASVVLDIQC
jgi:hypothetical protein